MSVTGVRVTEEEGDNHIEGGDEDNEVKCPMNLNVFAENVENAIALNAYSDIQNRTSNPQEDSILFILSLQQNICIP